MPIRKHGRSHLHFEKIVQYYSCKQLIPSVTFYIGTITINNIGILQEVFIQSKQQYKGEAHTCNVFLPHIRNPTLPRTTTHHQNKKAEHYLFLTTMKQTNKQINKTAVCNWQLSLFATWALVTTVITNVFCLTFWIFIKSLGNIRWNTQIDMALC